LAKLKTIACTRHDSEPSDIDLKIYSIGALYCFHQTKHFIDIYLFVDADPPHATGIEQVIALFIQPTSFRLFFYHT